MTKKTSSQKKVLETNKKQILEGSRAIALTIKNIEPAVVSAYPITPQTHIVEDLAKFKADEKVPYEYVRAESEFAAASIVLGASASGLRTYSATSSQGLLLMMEVLYNISGLRLPIVMTCANRAISSPINIWNDHSDAMAAKDSAWLQFFAETNQEAIYLHLLAYKIAEQIRFPVIVNMDGYILTHAYEAVYLPSKALIKKYLPNYKPEAGTYLDPKNPVTMGGFFPSAEYFDLKKQQYLEMQKSLSLIKKEYSELKKIFPLKTGNGLVEYFGDKKAKTILVVMGSLSGTIKSVIKGQKNVALLRLQCFRPFPTQEIKRLTGLAKNIIVLEKAVAVGSDSHLKMEIQATINDNKKNIKSCIVGLGGQDVSEASIKKIIKEADIKSDKPIFIK